MDISLFTNEKERVVTSRRVLYTASSFAKTALMYLQEIGTLTAKKVHTSKRSNLDSYLFIMVCGGRGSISYDNGKYELEAGDCVFIDCRKPYSHTTSEKELWTLKWIHFNGNSMPPVYEKYLSRGGLPVIRGVGEDTLEKLKDIHNTLFDTASGNEYVRDMSINEGLSGLLTLLMELAWNPDAKSKGRTGKDLLSLRIYLEEHFTEKISLEELSEKFYINKFYLTRIFKEQYGVSVNTYLQQLRITRAKQLLRFTDSSLEEIGLKCGIGEPNYFSRVFKKIEGISPSRYRDEWRDR